VLFLQALPPEARLKFSGYSGTTQQLMNEADSYVITLRQEKQHKLPVSVASNKQERLHRRIGQRESDSQLVLVCYRVRDTSTLATSKNLFLPRINSSSGKCSLKFIGPKV